MNIIAKLFKKIVREENTDIKNTFELFKKGILVYGLSYILNKQSENQNR